MTRAIRTDPSRAVVPPLELPSGPPPVVQVGRGYIYVPPTRGGVPPYSYSRSGTWPGWLPLDSSTGVMEAADVPSEGTFTGLSYTVTDAAANSVTLTGLSITAQTAAVGEPPLDFLTLAEAFIPGAIYASADNGDDANSGTWTNFADIAGTYRPVKSLDRLMQLLNATSGPQTIVLEACEEWYRRIGNWDVTYGDSDNFACVLSRNGLTIHVWGPADKRAKFGGDRVISGWSSIGSGEGTAFSEAEGEKVTLPWAAEADCAPCIGNFQCKPAFWASNKPNIESASTELWDVRYRTSEIYERIPEADINRSTSHDLAKRVSRNSTTAELILTAPGMAARYGAGDLIDTVIRAPVNANLTGSMIVSAQDNLNERVTAPMPSSMSLSTDKFWTWAFLANFRDVVQREQYGFRPKGSGERELHVVWPAGASGTKSVVFFENVLLIQGDDVRVSARLLAGRCWGTALQFRCNKLVAGAMDVVQQLRLRPVGGTTTSANQSRAGAGLIFNRRTISGSARGINNSAFLGRQEEVWSGGGVRLDNVANTYLFGGRVFGNDASTYRAGSDSVGCGFENAAVRVQLGQHGNAFTGYEKVNRVVRSGGSGLFVVRAITHQTSNDSVGCSAVERVSATVGRITTVSPHKLASGQWVKLNGISVSGALSAAWNIFAQVTVVNDTQFTISLPADPGAHGSGGTVLIRPLGYQGKRLRVTNHLIIGGHEISASTDPPIIQSGQALNRFDNDLQGSILKRVIAWNSSNPFSIAPGMSSGSKPYSNEDALIVNCVLQDVALRSLTGGGKTWLAGDAPFGGSPLALRHCFIGDSSVTANGCTLEGIAYNASAIWAGALTTGADGMWNRYSRVTNEAGAWDGSSYEEARIGEVGILDGSDWMVPAYSASPSFPGTHPAALSHYRYPRNAPEGWPMGYYLGAMPGSTLSLPAGQLDNNFAHMFRGLIRVGAGNRATAASYSFRVRETNAAFPGPGWIERDFTVERGRPDWF